MAGGRPVQPKRLENSPLATSSWLSEARPACQRVANPAGYRRSDRSGTFTSIRTADSNPKEHLELTERSRRLPLGIFPRRMRYVTVSTTVVHVLFVESQSPRDSPVTHTASDSCQEPPRGTSRELKTGSTVTRSDGGPYSIGATASDGLQYLPQSTCSPHPRFYQHI